MKVLVAETKWTGHHLFFARELAETLLGSPHQVVLDATADTADLPRRMAELAFDDIDPRIEVHHSLHGPPRGFSRISDEDGAIEADAIRTSIRDHRPDVLVLPSADAVAFHVGRGTSDPIDVESTRFVLHQPYVGYGGQGIRFAVKRELLRRRYGRLRARVAALDHRIATSLAGRPPVTIVPHPPVESETTDRSTARRRYHLEDEETVFLAAGEHSLRKGTHRLVECWPEVDATLLVVGRCSDDVHRAIEARRARSTTGRILVVDGAIENQAYADAFRAADVVTVCYPRHFGASGVLNAAIAHARPVLGSDYGAVGDTIRGFGLGTAVDCTDPAALSAALRRATIDPPRIDPDRRRPIAEFHTRGNLVGTVRNWVLGEENGSTVPFPFDSLR